MSDAVKAISFKPAVKARGYENETTTKIYLNAWQLQPGKSYSIHVAPMDDIYGNRLSAAEDYTVDMPDYRPDFDMESEHEYV